MKTLLLSLVCLTTATAQTTPAQLQALRKFAEDVCLKKLTGNDQRVIRYTASPAISLYNDADPAADAVFAAVVADFNAALQPIPFALSVAPIRSESAPVRVIYCPRDKFVTTCKSHQVTPEGNRDWVAWYWWDEDHRIKNSLAIITYDPARAENARRTTSQALLYALGFGGFTSQPVPSVLSIAAREPAQQLTNYDRSLLAFFHTALQPGDKITTVRKAFDKSWK